MKNFVTPNSHPSSFLTGSTVEAMVDKFKELGTGYYVCTDNGYLTNALKAYNLAKKKGLKPILGCEIYVKDDSLSSKIKYYTITLHARNQEQYQYLVKQLSDKTRTTIEILEQEYPLFNMKDLEVFAEKGFVAVVGGPQCVVSKNLLIGEHELALNTFKRLAGAFADNFYGSIIPMKFDKKWVTSSVFTFVDGETVTLDSTIMAETDYAKTFRVPLKEVADKHGKHKSIKKIYVNGIGYKVNRDIASACNHKDFKSMGTDVYETYNKFMKAFCERYKVPMLINDYSYLAKEDDKLVQDLKLGEEIKLYTNHHICNINDVLPVLSNICDTLEIEKMVENSYDFASKFDDFELKYDYQLVKEHDNHLKATLDLIKKVGRFDESNSIHRERLQHEIKVIHGNGKIDLLPYFFPISGVINYYKEKGRVVGPARGCLTKDTLVYTNNGVKNLDKIKVGDYVISHTGQWRKVLDTMVYDINEELLNIKTQYSYNSNTMTKDHKVYGIKRTVIDGHTSKTKKYKNWNEKDVKWYKAEEMEEGDLLFTPWPNKVRNEIEIPKKIDIAKYFKNKKYDDNYVYIEKPLYNEFSLRKIAKNTGLAKSAVKRLKENGNCREYNIKKIEEYLLKHNTSIEEWQKNKNTKTLKIKRFIDFDKKLCNFIGRWIGDGWLTKQNNGIGICFNTNEKEDIKYYTSYLKTLGWDIYENKSKNKKLVQYTIRNSEIWTLFRKMFPNYNFTSNSKHMSFWKKTPKKYLKWILEGLLGADGHVRNNHQSSFQKESIDTTSKILAEEIRESLLILKIPSSIFVRESFVRKQKNKEYLCKKSYKVSFIGIGIERSNHFNFSTKKGYFSKITNISKKTDNRVYDITVEKDHSYTTVDYVVHNSAGGSFLMYCMGITQIDPIKYGLYFSRFLTLGRILSGSLPDVDVDLNSRDLLVEKNGFFNTHYDERWAQVSTRTIMKLKSSIRDVNRFKFGKVEEEIERFAKNLEATPQGISDADFVFGYEDNEGNHVAGLLDKDEKLKAYTQERPEEWEIVKRTLGISRQNGRHASAFVISNKLLTDIIPTMKVSGHENITQYEAKEVEEAGLIKYDFLIIKVLNDIQLAIENINKKNYYENGNVGKLESGHFFHKGDSVYIWDLPEEPEVFDMLGEGKTETVFQLNTTSVTPYVIDMKPRSVEDCAVVTSLVRPGPLEFIDEKTGRNMAQEYVERRHGRSRGEIPILDELLPETYGVMVFQEQINRITKELTGWDDEKAEDVRIAVGKKKLRMIEELKPQFIEASAKTGRVDAYTAATIWAMIEKFGRYGFNKSHAVAYSMVAYACAYLKHHYPLEWWAAVLSNAEEKEITEVLWPHVKNILSPPDINLSKEEMVIDYNSGTIRNKLSVLRGLGEKAANKITENRPYANINELVEKEVLGTALAEKLTHIGVLDSLFDSKMNLMEKMQAYKDAVEVWKYKKKIFEKSEGEIVLNQPLEKFIEVAKKHPKTRRCKHEIRKGVIDMKYAFMNPMKDYILKKSIFPTMPMVLHDIIKENSNNVKIIDTGTSVYAMSECGKETRMINGKTYQKIKELPVEQDSRQVITFCVAGYVVESKEFSYGPNREKKALKMNVDVDGHLEEFVIWPDYDTGILEYPENLKKNSVIFLFMHRKMGRERYHTNIDSVIVEEVLV